ncbi:MAG: hypothetical protein JXM72_05570 [Deltaproteobacteria bacterium]|nr:hypothetical protein [Deltaproteobacteria bacterium]
MTPLEKKVVEFARLLRRFNINTSYSGIADALEAITFLGPDREDFFNALKATLIKQRADIPVFVSLFRIYFGDKPQGPPKEATGDPFEGPPDGSDDGRETARVEGGNSPGVVTEQLTRSRNQGEPYLLLIKAVRENDYDMLQYLAHQGVQNLGLVYPQDVNNAQTLVKKAKETIGWQKAIDELFGGMFSARSFFSEE